MEVKELLNKNLADVAKSNPGGDMWFFQDPKLKGWYLEDEEKDGNFSYWHLYNSDDEHTGTISVENGVITQLPRNLSENKLPRELNRMYKLAGLINENESFEEGKWGRGGSDPWADIETGGEYSKSKERVSAAYKRQREEDQDLGSASHQSFISKIKRLGSLMTDDEAIDMVDDMKRMLSHNEIVNVYRFLDNNNISSPIYTHLDGYVGEMGGLRNQGDLYENENLDEAIEGGLTFDELPDKIKDYFRRNITMSVAFVKKDGSVRHMAFRRNLKSYEKSDKEKTDRQANVLSNNNLMNVYDTNSFIRLKRETGDAAQAAKGSFRNFKLDNVLAFLVGGQLFDMRDQNKIEERFGEEVYAILTPSMISALKSDEAKGSEDVPPYEGPENPLDNQVFEDTMIKEGQLGRAITKMLIEEMLKEGVGPFASNAPRGPYGVNRYQIGHPDYEKDMEKLKADREEEEKRKKEDLKSYGTPIYDPQTGRGWTPETLTTYVKKKYDVDVPEEVYSKSDPNKPWMAIKNIQDYLADLSKK